MRVCLISVRIGRNIEGNHQLILDHAERAVELGAELILLPEAAATGLVITGVPEIDYNLAEFLPGKRNSQWRSFAAKNKIFIGGGFLEREGDAIYDSAVMFDPEGSIALHYKRIDSGWRTSDCKKSVYKEGHEIQSFVSAQLGKISCLICGDLWNPDVLRQLNSISPDLVLYPFARSMNVGSDFAREWELEKQAYCEQWRQLNTRVLAVNLLGRPGYDVSIGGSWYLESDGREVISSPVLEESFLLFDIE